MDRIFIQGGRRLSGEIHVQGAKNHALKALAASVLFPGMLRFENVPEIQDTFRLLEILESAGAKWVHKKKNVYEVNASKLQTTHLHKDLTGKLRASVLLLGPILSRYGSVSMDHPGGCVLGRRPIDIFLEGFRAMGVKVQARGNRYTFRGKPKATTFVFPVISVTATETLMLAAVLAKGRTVLTNAAQEPEIPALAEYLNSCGAKILGAGTSTLVIQGVSRLTPRVCRIIPDRIETGSFLIMAAATKSHLKILDCEPAHIVVLLDVLRRMGLRLKVKKSSIEVFPSGTLKSYSVVTHEYPGFATDLQAPMTVLLTQCHGQSLVRETIYEGRLFYVDLLNRMGANILLCDPNRVLVTGPTKLRAKVLESPDIRAGIAMVIAALIAKGTSQVHNVYQIERGYENIVERLKTIGAHVQRG